MHVPLGRLPLCALALSIIIFICPARALACPFVPGAIGDGVADNSPQLSAALGTLGPNGGCLSFPAGTFYFATPVVYSYPATAPYAVSIRGAGSNVTVLDWAGDGIRFNLGNQLHSAHFQDLSLTTRTNNTATAIYLHQSACLGFFARSNFVRLAIRLTLPAGFHWRDGIVVDGLSGTDADGVVYYGAFYNGTGITYQGRPDCYSIYHNVTRSIFNNSNIGITYGSHAQGLNVMQSNFENGRFGIVVPGTAQGQSDLRIIGNEFAQIDDQIQVNAWSGSATITGNDMFCRPGKRCLNMPKAAHLVFTGNHCNGQQSGSICALIDGTQPGTGAMVTGNFVSNNGVGIKLGAGSSNVNVQANKYLFNGTNVQNLGIANQVGGGSP